MIANSPVVNPPVFTCSICGEASINICAYCTKDACSNHRCERCKRCSDCCECEYPLSAEEPVVAAAEPVAEATESIAPQLGSSVAAFLTPEEASVFAEEKPPAESNPAPMMNVFVEEAEPTGEAENSSAAEDPGDAEDPRDGEDPETDHGQESHDPT